MNSTIIRSSYAQDIALALLQIGAITLSPKAPYTWASGIVSPMYCDNRLTLSYPYLRQLIADAFVDSIQTYSAQVEAIAGTATAGIAHAAFVADRMGLPMAYVRSSAKGHGKQNLVEGRLLQNQYVAVVEDTVSTGGSVLAAITGLREEGVKVAVALSIFTYGFSETYQAFQDIQVPLITLTDFETLVQVAADHDYLRQEEVESILAFQKDPRSFRV